VNRSQQLLELWKGPRVGLATVSGIWSTKPAIIRWIDEHIPAFDIITTKSFQLHPNPGNREPIIAEKSEGNYTNAVGLRNPGMVKVRQELQELLSRPLRSFLNVSISGSSPEEFIQLIEAFEPFADCFELNFSCPHAKPGYGSTIGSSPELVELYMNQIRRATDSILFPKLTPNVPDVGLIAEIAARSGADGIAAVNTFEPEQTIEPHSGQPVLYNPNGRKGGVSGSDIFAPALKQIARIREAVGPDLPILGMGGVSSPEDARKMADAGAQVIGLGSVFARVRFQDRIRFMQEFSDALADRRPAVSVPLIPGRQAQYHAYRIHRMTEISDTMRIFSLEGDHDMNFKPSQYAFLWIPDAGEKPFSIVKSSPLEFIVRKRHRDLVRKSGIFTEALFRLREGDELYARGPYGAGPALPSQKNILLVSGGTGIAALPSFARELHSADRSLQFWHGMSSPGEEVYSDELSAFGPVHQIADQGQPGRVLHKLQESLQTLSPQQAADTAFYIIGPEIFMKKGLQIARRAGIPGSAAFASLETNNMCGIGICGECECGGELSCHRGTFYDSDYLFLNYFK